MLNRRFAILALACWCGAFADRAAFAADPKLVAAAEQEGQLAIYNCDIGESPVQVKRFSELYPKIKVTTYVASCWQTYNRHAAERGAGRPIADAFISTDDVFMKMDDEGMLEGYASPELAHFPGRHVRPTNANYIRYKALLAAFTLNTEQMKGQPVPQDWTDFADPPAQWKDKISFYDPRTSSLAFTVLATLHQQFGAERCAKNLCRTQVDGRGAVVEHAGRDRQASVGREAHHVLHPDQSIRRNRRQGRATGLQRAEIRRDRHALRRCNRSRTRRIRTPPSCGPTSSSQKARRSSPAAPNMPCAATPRRRKACRS